MSWSGYIPGSLLRDLDEQGLELAPFTGRRLKVHASHLCKGNACSIHNPSDHHMKDWRRHWRSDRGLMERLCAHGVGHPDPDDLAYKLSILSKLSILNVENASAEGVHGCDGCCQRKVIKDQSELTS